MVIRKMRQRRNRTFNVERYLYAVARGVLAHFDVSAFSATRFCIQLGHFASKKFQPIAILRQRQPRRDAVFLPVFAVGLGLER